VSKILIAHELDDRVSARVVDNPGIGEESGFVVDRDSEQFGSQLVISLAEELIVGKVVEVSG
jgi:hypothetical protein